MLVLNLSDKAIKNSVNIESNIPVEITGETATVFATDYLNKLSGEKIERECKRQLDAGCKTIVVNFVNVDLKL